MGGVFVEDITVSLTEGCLVPEIMCFYMEISMMTSEKKTLLAVVAS